MSQNVKSDVSLWRALGKRVIDDLDHAERTAFVPLGGIIISAADALLDEHANEVACAAAPPLFSVVIASHSCFWLSQTVCRDAPYAVARCYCRTQDP